jgi:ribosomal protein S18 acetylase RimI-like enzyme
MTTKEKIIIRKYIDQDKEDVLNLLRLNTPTYFSAEEEKDLVYYLDNKMEYFFVLVISDKVIGCGGINFSEDKTVGKLSWDILNPNFQRQGLGTLLLYHRIALMKENKDIKRITVRTSQHVYKFYEKSGFKLMEKVKDYWAKGFDLYTMEYTKI